MTRISIADDLAAPTVEVDLWGALFDVVAVTRSRQKAINALQRQVTDLDEDEEDAEDKAVALMAKTLDQMLVPQAGKRKLASTHIIEKYHAEELAAAQLGSFLERLLSEVNSPPT
jgi:hypothetical protein